MSMTIPPVVVLPFPCSDVSFTSKFIRGRSFLAEKDYWSDVTLGIHLCSACNRRTTNVLHDDVPAFV